MTDAPRQCRWCYELVYNLGPCPKCEVDHADGVQKGLMGAARKHGSVKLDYQEINWNEYHGDHYE